MKKTFVNWLGLTIVCLIMLLGCSPGIVKESWEGERRYSPRKELPEILNLDPLKASEYKFIGEFQIVDSEEKALKVAAKRGAEYVVLGKGRYTVSHVEKDIFDRTTNWYGSDDYDMVHVSMYRRTSAEEREAMALSEAIKSGRIDHARSTIASGYDVNAKTPKGYTALMAAARGGHLELVKALQKAGADVNAKNNDGWTALMFAAQKGDLEIVKDLLEAGADVNAKSTETFYQSTVLRNAAAFGHTDVVKTLLKAGADVNAKNSEGWTALSGAAFSGHTDVVKALLRAGADVNAKDRRGRTALWNARSEGHTDIEKLLQEYGAED